MKKLKIKRKNAQKIEWYIWGCENIVEKRLVSLKFDLMFKKVFGDENDKRHLRKLLKCILDINPKEITILNLEMLSLSYYDKRTIVDLIVELDDGTK